MLFIKLNSTNDEELLTTESSALSMLTNEQSCIYCQTTACYCPSTQFTLNCSSYVFNLPFITNCTELIIWKTVDFSLRNLTKLDSTDLLSLRMERLILKSNLIAYIDGNTLDSVANILIELNLEMNRLLNTSWQWLNSNLIYLQKLNLALNQLKNFDDIDDILLPNLKELNLSHNRINNFPSKIYRWTSLVKLDLSFNKLFSVPRYALTGLSNLTWLSLASNRNLSCVIQDSFKQLKSLEYLDLSRTNLLNLDGCIFVQLSGLRTLSIERIFFNCSSCWLSIERKKPLQILGHCLHNEKLRRIDSLTDKQREQTCIKSSIDCTIDYCEPGSIGRQTKTETVFSLSKGPHITESRERELILSIVFSIVTLSIILTSIILICRWRQNKKPFCCHLAQTTATAEETRRRRQQIIDKNPAVIESVVTHGANMNVPTHSRQNYSYTHDETSNNKRKLYNPMFADSPLSDIRHHQQHSIKVSNDNTNTSHNSQIYSEKL